MPLSPSQRDVHQRLLENRQLEFLAILVGRCNSQATLPGDEVQRMIAAIEEASRERQAFEDAADPATLTPLHFELSAALDRLHDHLSRALVEGMARATGGEGNSLGSF